jgi:hypothetical protein
VEVPLSAAAVRERSPKLEPAGQHRMTPPRGGPAAAPTAGLPGMACQLSAWRRAVAGRRRAVQSGRPCRQHRFIHSSPKTAA